MGISRTTRRWRGSTPTVGPRTASSRDTESMELRPHRGCHPWTSDPWPTAPQGQQLLKVSPHFSSLSLVPICKALWFPDAISICDSLMRFPHARRCTTEPPWGFLPLRRPPILLPSSAPLCFTVLVGVSGFQCLFMSLSPKKGSSEYEEHVSVM